MGQHRVTAGTCHAWQGGRHVYRERRLGAQAGCAGWVRLCRKNIKKPQTRLGSCSLPIIACTAALFTAAPPVDLFPAYLVQHANLPARVIQGHYLHHITGGGAPRVNDPPLSRSQAALGHSLPQLLQGNHTTNANAPVSNWSLPDIGAVLLDDCQWCEGTASHSFAGLSATPAHT